ncbi:hypothetical protein [Nocardioides aurantiacus]
MASLHLDLAGTTVAPAAAALLGRCCGAAGCRGVLVVRAGTVDSGDGTM